MPGFFQYSEDCDVEIEIILLNQVFSSKFSCRSHKNNRMKMLQSHLKEIVQEISSLKKEIKLASLIRYDKVYTIMTEHLFLLIVHH